MPPSKAESSNPDPQDEKPMAMPTFRWSPPPADPSMRRAPASVPVDTSRVRPLVKKPEAKSAALSWPAAQVQELNKRRMLLQEEREQRSVSPVSPSTPTESASTPRREAVPKVDKIETSTALSPNSEKAAETVLRIPPSQRLLASTKAGVQHIELLMRSLLLWARERQSRFVTGLGELKERIQRASKAAALAKTLRAVNAPQQRSRDTEPAAPIRSEHIESAPVAAVPDTRSGDGAPRSRGMGVIDSARQLWARRVLIRISAGKQLQGITARISSAYDAAAAYPRKNERLASSMSMAALSALLALGLILAIRHYNPAGQSSVRSVSVEKSAAQPPATAGFTTAPARAATASEATSAPIGKPDAGMSIVTPARLAVSAPRGSAARKVPGHRTHRSSDEDYVAPDTYVYYGKH